MATEADIIAEARSWIGTPYVHQASLKGVGADCLGIVRGIYRELVGPEPVVPAYPEHGDAVALAELLAQHLVVIPASEPGCVATIRWQRGLRPSHCAIITASGTMIHSRARRAVREEPITTTWERAMVNFYRFPDAED